MKGLAPLLPLTWAALGCMGWPGRSLGSLLGLGLVDSAAVRQLIQAVDMRRDISVDPEGWVWSGLTETIFSSWILTFIDLVQFPDSLRSWPGRDHLFTDVTQQGTARPFQKGQWGQIVLENYRLQALFSLG